MHKTINNVFLSVKFFIGYDENGFLQKIILYAIIYSKRNIQEII